MSESVDVSHQGASISSMADKAGKYLSFNLAEEEYGLEILKVMEIIGMMNVTIVPKTPKFVRGVINLRGKVIPVVDLRLRFGLEALENTERTCIIVVQLTGSTLARTMGIIVDEVCEVLDINAEQVEPTPVFGTSVNSDFILGMGKVEDKVVLMLDIDRVLSTLDLDLPMVVT